MSTDKSSYPVPRRAAWPAAPQALTFLGALLVLEVTVYLLIRGLVLFLGLLTLFMLVLAGILVAAFRRRRS